MNSIYKTQFSLFKFETFVKNDFNMCECLYYIFRPFVVSAMWLAECYKQGQTVSEEGYTCLDLAPTEEAPKVKG